MVHTRHSLEKLSRPDLQKLCKDYGVKANLKSEAIIDLILDANTPKPAPVRTRSVSTRLPSSKQRHSSIVVHESTPGRDIEAGRARSDTSGLTQSSQEDSLPPATRTRKAKDTQTRLGVGRPRLAGGEGARAVTKSASLSRTRRAKSSKNLRKPVEDAITEELEPDLDEADEVQPVPVELVPDDAETQMQPPEGTQTESTPKSNALSSLADVDKYVADAIRPLHEQLQSFKNQVDQINTLKSEVDKLQSQVARADALQEQVALLTLEVKELRTRSSSTAAVEDEVTRLKEVVILQASRLDSVTAQASRLAFQDLQRDHSQSQLATLPSPSTPNFTSTPIVRPVSNITPVNDREVVSPMQHDHPGFAPSTLGKRHRSPCESDTTRMLEQIDEDGLKVDKSATRLAPSPKKRARISSEGSTGRPTASLLTTRLLEEQQAPPRSTFSIFTGAEPNDTDQAPPTSHLPNFYGPPSPSDARGSRTAGPSSSQATENRPTPAPGFSLAYMVPPTPGSVLFPSAFPLLETPESPSPQQNSELTPAVYRARNDMFHALGLPNPGRTKPAAQPQCVNPAALTHSQPVTGQGTAIQPSRRTMFGTELEDDTRFGEFGTEGVGAPFWGRL
jgi:regulator of replication initiation timing